MKNLKTISFAIPIDADREKVWNTLWDPENYRKWAGVFSEGSRYRGELKQGHTIYFLGKEDQGMSSIVEEVIENEHLAFAHQKEIKDGVEQDSSWQGAREIYNLKEEPIGGIELQVTLDVTPEMEDYFRETFPKALNIIKEISEQ